jgi:hypothetical protein
MYAPIEGVEFDVVEAVSQVLHRASRKAPGAPTNKKTLFDTRYAPTVSIHEYAERLKTYMYCSDECHVLSLVYVERILIRTPGFALDELNVHRLLLAATVIAAKFQDDDVYSNKYYARVGGVTCTELTALESEFLALIGWAAHVSAKDYNRCLHRLQSHALSAVLIDVDAKAEVRPEVQAQSAPQSEAIEGASVDEKPQKLQKTGQTETIAEATLETVQTVPGLLKTAVRRSSKVAAGQPSKQCRWSCQRQSRRKDAWRRPRTRFEDKRSRTCAHECGRSMLWKAKLLKCVADCT